MHKQNLTKIFFVEFQIPSVENKNTQTITVLLNLDKNTCRPADFRTAGNLLSGSSENVLKK